MMGRWLVYVKRDACNTTHFKQIIMENVSERDWLGKQSKVSEKKKKNDLSKEQDT